MSTMLRDILSQQGTHGISTINSRWAKPLVNGAVIEENLDNGLLVSLDGYDSDTQLLKCKAYTGTGDAYILQTAEEEQLMVDMGETDYKCFYNKAGEIVRLFKVETDLRQEVSSYEVGSGVTLALGLPVEYDSTNKKFKVVSTSTAQVATLVGIDTDFGYNAGASTIRIQYL